MGYHYRVYTVQVWARVQSLLGSWYGLGLGIESRWCSRIFGSTKVGELITVGVLVAVGALVAMGELIIGRTRLLYNAKGVVLGTCYDCHESRVRIRDI